MKVDDPKKCFRNTIILDFYCVLDYLNQHGYPNLSSDDMFAMFDGDDRFHNDMYWHLYRHWIKDENAQTLWDIICLELGIEQVYQEVIDGHYTSPTQLIFWVSW